MSSWGWLIRGAKWRGRDVVLAALLLLFWTATAAAGQHRFFCAQAPQTFQLCKGNANSCGAIPNDNNDAITIEGMTPGTVIGMFTTFTSVVGANGDIGKAPARVHFHGQGTTTFDEHRLFTSIGENFSASYTITTQTTFDVQFQIDNPNQFGGEAPQFFEYAITCAQGPTTGSITIVKSTTAGDGTFPFTSTIPGGANLALGTAGGTAQQSFIDIPAGTYTVSEMAVAGWNLTGLSCTVTGTGGSTTSTSLPTATITLRAGDNVSCAYTNTPIPPAGGSITIVKANVGGPSNTPFSFATTGAGLPNFTLAPGQGQTASRTFTGLAAGAFTITETVPANWTLTGLTCVAAGASVLVTAAPTATITLAASDTVTCTFTDTYAPPPGTGLIRIVKTAVGSNGQFSFTTTGAGFAGFSLTTGGSDTGGTANREFPTLATPGTYTVQETGSPAGWNFTSLTCVVTGSGGTTASVSGILATIALKAGDAVVCTYVNTVATAPTPASITIVKRTTSGVDAAFNFVSSIPGGASFTLTTVETIASRRFSNLGNGTYTVSEGTLGPGWRLQSLSCTSSATVNVATRSATITIASGIGVTCTFTNVFDDVFVRKRTSETIRNFMTRRADLITSEEPDRNRFIRRLTGSLWGGASGNGAPFAFAGFNSERGGTSRFSTSMNQMIQAANRANQTGGAGGGGARSLDSDWNPDIDIWMEAHYNHYTENRIGYDRSGNFGIMWLGADYLYSPRLLVGAMLQLDTMSDKWSTTGVSVSGDGWMAGPYATVRLTDNLFLDGRVAWGESYNKVSPFGAYTDKFYTQRGLARANLTGSWQYDRFRVTPSVGVTYFQEQQFGYTDSLHVEIPAQRILLGRTTFGSEFGYRFEIASRTIIEPHIALTGIWDFAKDRSMSIQGVTVGVQDLRAKVQAGVLVKTASDFSMRWGVSYDGIGDKSLNIYGTQLWVSMPLIPSTGLTAARARGHGTDWSGFYLGGQAGVSNTHFRNELSFNGNEAPGTSGGAAERLVDPTGGLFAGYNLRVGKFVVGAEADVIFRRNQLSPEAVGFTVPLDTDDGFFISNRFGTTAFLRGRFGYAWDKALFYAAGGLAYGELQTRVRPFDGPDGDMPKDVIYSQKSRRLGWTASAGIDYALSGNLFGRAEFRYSQFGKSAFDLTDPALQPKHGPNTNDTSVSIAEGLFGVGYRF